jgi:predicted RND superfamily exporter protein
MSHTITDRPTAAEDDEIVPPRGNRVFEWLGAHIKIVVIAVMVAGVVIGIGGYAQRAGVANPEDPAFDPGGPIYDIQDREAELFEAVPDVVTAQFFVETDHAASGDVLTAASLAEFQGNASRLRSDPTAQSHLTTRFDPDLGIEIDGISSIADVVDERLEGGLAAATDADVKLALAEILADDSPLAGFRSRLSQLTTTAVEDVDGVMITVWRSPAFLADVVYDRTSFEIDDPDDTDQELVDFEYAREGELWLRDVQDVLGTDHDSTAVLGLAIDQILTDEEQGNATAPFIMLSIVLIVLLVGALVRSYWASAIVAAGLAVTFQLYTGLLTVIGLHPSVLVDFIVPIAVLSFGVDFFIHGFERCREQQATGLTAERAFPVGMTAAALAVLLAMSTSVVAFFSNATSSIEAIREFGIAAGLGLVIAYLVIGLLGPKVVLAIEDRLGPRPATRGPRLGSKLGFLAMSLLGGVMVTLTIVATHVGIIAFLVLFLPLGIVLPYRLARRRNRRAAERGRPLVSPAQGRGNGLRAAGSVVHFLARWRVVTVPVTVLLAGVGVYGFTQVEEAFHPSDFIASNTDLIASIDKLEQHLGESTGTSAYLYAEGDLTAPSTLRAIDAVIADVDATDEAERAAGAPTFLARDFDGAPVAAPNAADLVRAVTASPEAVASVTDATGVSIETDADGFPTTADQIAAIYEYAAVNGVPGADGRSLWSVEDVGQAIHVGDSFQATRITVELATVSDLDLMAAAGDALADSETQFESAVPGLDMVGVSGHAVADEHRLNAFTDSMLLSLLVAFVLCALIAMVFMRSVKYALVSVVPILLVVGWVYAFMYAFDYAINPVTATIAAISIGVGVDFAMHFTMRFREEYVGEPSRFPALRRAAEGTGGALVLSALTSIGGFLVMSRAPMPVFADFGLLTAVMILFSLIVALFVLPSMLLLVTPSRRGEERQALLDALRTEHDDMTDYDPHSRATAIETAHL